MAFFRSMEFRLYFFHHNRFKYISLVLLAIATIIFVTHTHNAPASSLLTGATHHNTLVEVPTDLIGLDERVDKENLKDTEPDVKEEEGVAPKFVAGEPEVEPKDKEAAGNHEPDPIASLYQAEARPKNILDTSINEAKTVHKDDNDRITFKLINTKDHHQDHSIITTVTTNHEIQDANSSNTMDSTTSSIGTTTVSNSSNFTATIIIQLSGEMGSHLSRMAYGYGLKWQLEDEYGIRSDVWFRHQERRKWLHARDDTKECFPFTREMDFERGNTDEFETKILQQDPSYIIGKKPVYDHLDLSHILEKFNNDLKTQRINATIISGLNETISMPFFYLDRSIKYETKRYYHKYRDIFRFDFEKTPVCCNPETKPYSDETILHIRNYIEEMRSNEGFRELGPNQTAKELLGHLHPGDKVAILSRFPGKGVQPFVKALEKRGLNVRVISENSGRQDFCFLLQAEKEIAGTSQSSYLMWAALLGNSKRVLMYDTRENNKWRSRGPDWSPAIMQPDLKKRIKFFLFSLNSTLDYG